MHSGGNRKRPRSNDNPLLPPRTVLSTHPHVESEYISGNNVDSRYPRNDWNYSSDHRTNRPKLASSTYVEEIDDYRQESRPYIDRAYTHPSYSRDYYDQNYTYMDRTSSSYTYEQREHPNSYHSFSSSRYDYDDRHYDRDHSSSSYDTRAAYTDYPYDKNHYYDDNGYGERSTLPPPLPLSSSVELYPEYVTTVGRYDYDSQTRLEHQAYDNYATEYYDGDVRVSDYDTNIPDPYYQSSYSYDSRYPPVSLTPPSSSLSTRTTPIFQRSHQRLSSFGNKDVLLTASSTSSSAAAAIAAASLASRATRNIAMIGSMFVSRSNNRSRTSGLSDSGGNDSGGNQGLLNSPLSISSSLQSKNGMVEKEKILNNKSNEIKNSTNLTKDFAEDHSDEISKTLHDEKQRNSIKSQHISDNKVRRYLDIRLELSMYHLCSSLLRLGLNPIGNHLEIDKVSMMEFPRLEDVQEKKTTTDNIVQEKSNSKIEKTCSISDNVNELKMSTDSYGNSSRLANGKSLQSIPPPLPVLTAQSAPYDISHQHHNSNTNSNKTIHEQRGKSPTVLSRSVSDNIPAEKYSSRQLTRSDSTASAPVLELPQNTNSNSHHNHNDNIDSNSNIQRSSSLHSRLHLTNLQHSQYPQTSELSYRDNYYPHYSNTSNDGIHPPYDYSYNHQMDDYHYNQTSSRINRHSGSRGPSKNQTRTYPNDLNHRGPNY